MTNLFFKEKKVGVDSKCQILEMWDEDANKDCTALYFYTFYKSILVFLQYLWHNIKTYQMSRHTDANYMCTLIILHILLIKHLAETLIACENKTTKQ